jgi:capsid protein
VDQVRWLTLIPRLCDPIHRACIDAGELAGLWQRDYAVDYSPPKWDYVNPEQDVKADAAEISLGLASVSEKLRMRGYEPEQVFAEIKSDLDRFRALGIDQWLLFKEKGKLPGDQQAANEPKVDAE